MTRLHLARRRGFTLLEIMLVLVITGILVAAIAAAINIHLRVSEVGRSEVEQAQLARVVLRRIGDDLRAAVPYVEPIESDAGATSAEVEAAIAAASSASGSTGTGGTSGGGTSSSGGSASSGGGSSSGSSSGGSSSSSGGSSGSGVQTLQTLGTLSALKPQSASSSSSGSSSGSAGGSASGGSSGSSTVSSSSSSGKSTSSSLETESSEEASTTTKPGIYGDQYTLQVDVSRAPRPGLGLPTAGLDAPGDVKTVGYYIAPVPGAIDALGQPVMGLYRQSFDKAVASFDASAGTTANSATQLLAEEVAAIEFRYFDGAAWQTSWDSSGGSLPTAVEVSITTLTHSNSPSGTITAPQVHRLTIAIPAAQSGFSSGTSTDTSTDASSSSSTGTTP